MAYDSYYDEDLTPEEIDLEYGEDDNNDDVISILSVASVWFIIFGLVIVLFLFLYFILTGKIFSACIYIVGMLVAYAFGYFFMYCLDHFVSNN